MDSKSEKKYLDWPNAVKLLAAYVLLTMPALIWHERHLPFFTIFILSVGALAVGSLLFLLSTKLYSKILEHGFHPFYEAIAIALFLLGLGMSGFLDNRGGRVFLSILALLAFILRFARVRMYYSLILLGMILLANGLVSFVALQKMEVFAAYHLFRSRFQFTEVDLSDWRLADDTRILTNRSIPIRLRLPDDMYFHNPKDLDLKDKTGAGQIAGILSYSDRDPTVYPSIRIFFFPVYVPVDDSALKEEVIKYIQFLEKRGEVEEVNEIQPNRDFRFENRIPRNAFWTFFDIIRPRYAKMGYYFLETKTGSRVLLHITENLEKGKYHETLVQSILDSIVLE